MNTLTRRGFALGGLAGLGLTAACGNGVGSTGGTEIDARVDATLNYLYTNHPNMTQLDQRSVGKLVMPLITDAGLGVGGAYGRGALRVDNISVDYYSVTKGSFGIQIGAQQFAHVLFFMTEGALTEFRRGAGWTAGADVQYVVSNESGQLRADTATLLAPVIAVVFGQTGLKVGATLEGAKYNRIIP